MSFVVIADGLNTIKEEIEMINYKIMEQLL